MINYSDLPERLKQYYDHIVLTATTSIVMAMIRAMLQSDSVEKFLEKFTHEMDDLSNQAYCAGERFTHLFKNFKDYKFCMIRSDLQEKEICPIIRPAGDIFNPLYENLPKKYLYKNFIVLWEYNEDDNGFTLGLETIDGSLHFDIKPEDIEYIEVKDEK